MITELFQIALVGVLLCCLIGMIVEHLRGYDDEDL